MENLTMKAISLKRWSYLNGTPVSELDDEWLQGVSGGSVIRSKFGQIGGCAA
jgi:hypothetical protein